MYIEFCKIYQDQFSGAYFGKLKNPKISTAYIKKGIENFVNGFLMSADRKYTKEFLWNPSYFFLGDLYSDLMNDGLCELEWIKFSKDTNTIKIDSEVFFAVMMLLRSKLLEKVTSLKGTGLPDWFKNELYDKFLRDLNVIISRDDLRAMIMRGRTKTCAYFSKDDEIFTFLKGSINDEKIAEVIDICKKRNPGWQKRKGFRTVQEFKQSVVKFLDTIKSSSLNMRNSVKDRRITKKKATRFLMYLALMSTIQTRINQPVSMHSAKEAQFFTYYEPLRAAATKLGWLEMFDSTYCPGVRTRTFIVKIMCRPVRASLDELPINKIERKYLDFAEENPGQEDQFAVQFSYNAIDYLKEKRLLILRKKATQAISSENKKLSFVIRQYGAKNGKLWTRMQYEKLRHNKNTREILNRDIQIFQLTYSDSRNFYWMPGQPRMVS